MLQTVLMYVLRLQVLCPWTTAIPFSSGNSWFVFHYVFQDRLLTGIAVHA